MVWLTEPCAGCIWWMWTTLCRAGGGHGRESKGSLLMLLMNLVHALNGVCLYIPLPSLFLERINCSEWHKHHCGLVVGLKRQPKDRCFQVCHPSGSFSEMWLSDGAVCLIHSKINEFWRSTPTSETNKAQKETQEYLKFIFFLLLNWTILSTQMWMCPCI